MPSTPIRFNSYNYDFIPEKNTKAPATLTQKPPTGKQERKGRRKLPFDVNPFFGWATYAF